MINSLYKVVYKYPKWGYNTTLLTLELFSWCLFTDCTMGWTHHHETLNHPFGSEDFWGHFFSLLHRGQSQIQVTRVLSTMSHLSTDVKDIRWSLEGSKFIQIVRWGLQRHLLGWGKDGFVWCLSLVVMWNSCVCLKIFRRNSEEIVLLTYKFSHFQGECFEAFYCKEIHFFCIKACGLLLFFPLVIDVVGVGC